MHLNITKRIASLTKNVVSSSYQKEHNSEQNVSQQKCLFQIFLHNNMLFSNLKKQNFLTTHRTPKCSDLAGHSCTRGTICLFVQPLFTIMKTVFLEEKSHQFIVLKALASCLLLIELLVLKLQ